MIKTNNLCATVRGLFKAIVLFSAMWTTAGLAFINKNINPNRLFRFTRLFHSSVLRVLGISVRVQGNPAPGSPVLFVANHVSYLDIPVLGSLLGASFIAKSEVESWPVFGILAKIQNTVFVERRASRAAKQCIQLRGIVREQNLILFPEGTSSDGASVLPFKSSLFGMIEDASSNNEVLIQPISIAFSEVNGRPVQPEERGIYAWLDVTLVQHLWNICKNKHLVVDVLFHDPLTMKDYPNRKLLASKCHEIVASGVTQLSAQISSAKA